MDKFLLGKRVADAREAAHMTQDGLARAVRLDRTAITRLEKGERKLSVPELVEIAQTLSRPLAYFVNDPVPAVINRRRDSALAHDSTRELEAELASFAADVRELLALGLLPPRARSDEAHAPRSHSAAEAMAARYRAELGIADDPIDDLGAICERLGLYTFSPSLGAGGADGACVEVTESPATLGAAVVNGETPSGRRRMTLAHELGHWLAGDAYDKNLSGDGEKMLNSFAVHFVAPRNGVARLWNANLTWSVRDRALAVAATFKLSWSAAVAQLANLGLVDHGQLDDLHRNAPKRGDYLRLGLGWTDDLADRYLSPRFVAACLQGYMNSTLTRDRTLELLRDTVSAADLPDLEPISIEDLRASFVGHDA